MKKGVTHKDTIPVLSIERLKTMTHKRNTITVDLKMTTYYYGFDSPYPGIVTQDDFGTIIENFAVCYRQGCMYLNINSHERYLCSFLGVDYVDCIIEPEIYNKYFKIVRPSKLAFKMHWDDVLYVYDEDDYLLVVTDAAAKVKFRELRGIK